MQFSCIICWGMSVFWIATPMTQFAGLSGRSWLSCSKCSLVDKKPECCRQPYSKDFRDECAQGFQLIDLDKTAFIIQLVSGVISLVPVVLASLSLCERSLCRPESSSVLYDKVLKVLNFMIGASFLLFPIAGCLSIIGCLLLLKKYSGFAASFYLCLASGILWLIYTAAVLVRSYIVYRKNKQESVLSGKEIRLRFSNFLGIWIQGFYFQDY